MPISTEGPETVSPATRDQQAVAAVLRGETSSYRELVERHQRLVYAVAWSRLGDATLAEDAAQEAFIRAYRSLPLLGNGAKFSAWVTAIARNTAISLGLKQRRELQKRARWALEQPVAEPPAAGAEEACSPELLRQTLAELPDEHRESLVLFYLEGKRGAEAAAALGISEAALRMRLMRARAALREKLEARLGESLEQLQPSHSFVPGVMGVIVSSSTAKAGAGAGLGTTILATLGKVLPFKIALLFVPLAVVYSFGATWLTRRDLQSQQSNLRDQDGFRARVYKKMSRRALFWANIKIAVFLGVLYMALKIFGLRAFGGIYAVFFLVVLANKVRLFRINRGKTMICMVIGLLLALGFNLAVVFGWSYAAGGWWTPMVLVLLGLQMFAFQAARPPPRLDYNLFLREQLGLLKNSGANTPVAQVGGHISSAQLFTFTRFLGERFLVHDFRWKQRDEELMLLAGSSRLSLALTLAGVFIPTLRWKNCSWIALKSDGGVSAHCDEVEAQKMREEPGQESKDIGEMEQNVARAVEAGWKSFRAGDIAGAERAIGQVPEAEIFIAPHPPVLTARGATKAVMIGVVIFVGLMLAMIPLGIAVAVIKDIFQAVKR